MFKSSPTTNYRQLQFVLKFDQIVNYFRIRSSADSGNMKRSALNNSLLDLSDNHIPAVFTGINMRDKPVRRGSVGSLGKLIPTK